MQNVKRLFSVIAVLAVIFLLHASTLYSQETAGQLFEKALYLEEAQGDLQGAIDLYERILKEFPQNREFAAKAQLHIGMCYEKLGKEEAQKAYQNVIDKYTDQQEAVSKARTRLAALTRSAETSELKGLTIMEVWPNFGTPIINLSRSSPDGRYFTGSHQNSADLTVFNIESKEGYKLTDNWRLEEEFLQRNVTDSQIDSFYSAMKVSFKSVWSTDGSKIAFTWCEWSGKGELRIVNFDGSNLRILPLKDEYIWPYPEDWTRNGKEILLSYWEPDSVHRFVIVSVSDGSMYFPKKEFEGESLGRALFTPDGKGVVFEYAQKNDEGGNSDIFLLDIENGNEIAIVNHPADDNILGWLPDGRLLISSDRSGTIDVWAITFVNGLPKNTLVFIKKDIGGINPIGITNKGSFYYALQRRMDNVYIAEINIESGAILNTPQLATNRYEGSNLDPDWSPDGNKLAYISIRGLEHDQPILCLKSLETGEERDLQTDLRLIEKPRWSPDSITILVFGANMESQKGFFQINIETGDVTPLITLQESGACDGSARWLPDQQTILYQYRPDGMEAFSRIVLFDTKTSSEKEILRVDFWPIPSDLSPDGTLFAYRKGRRLNIFHIASGESKELVRVEEGKHITTVAWTPDGNYILYGTMSGNNDEPKDLWRISRQGGTPQKINIETLRLGQLRIHPDGKRIAYRFIDRKDSIWVMENF